MLEVDSSAFDAMCVSLAEISGRDFGYVLLDQARTVLKLCLAHTPIASVENITKIAYRDYVEFPSGEAISIWKKADGAIMFLTPPNGDQGKSPPAHTVNGMSWHDMNGGRRWSPALWSHFQDLYSQMDSIKEERLRTELKARGVTAQSWVQVAEDLGISAAEIGAPHYVQEAVGQNGPKKYGSGREIFDDASAVIEIENSNWLLVNKLERPSGEAILQASIDARRKAFDIDVQFNVFSDLAQRAKRYPGIFVTE